MSLSIGIVGLPNVGKSTLFNALTRQEVSAENYPFCTIDPSVGVVPVPDDRLEKLSQLSNSEKTLPAVVEFVDIAGLVKGASAGEGLGNKFLSHVRGVDALAHVVRLFPGDVTHVHGEINPLHDVEIINTELVLADVASVERRLEKIEKEIKRGDKEAKREKEILDRLYEVLSQGKLASSVTLDNDELEIVEHLDLLTQKPILFVLNTSIEQTNVKQEYKEFFDYLEEKDSQYVFVDAASEEDLRDLDEDEREDFLDGIKSSSVAGLAEFINASYRLLNLITFFTTGEKETRGWTVEEGSTAPEAGRVIHSDFQDKFIRAEVIHCDMLLKAGSYKTAREQGLLRLEGKDYVVQDGDVIEFKI